MSATRPQLARFRLSGSAVGEKMMTTRVRADVLAGMFYNQMLADDAFVEAMTAAFAEGAPNRIPPFLPRHRTGFG